MALSSSLSPLPYPMPPILLLPHELVDIILSSIHRPADLLAFALTSKTSYDLCVLRHLDYRWIRVGGRNEALWERLARRMDLARGVRRVEFADGDERVPRDVVVVNGGDSAAGKRKDPVKHLEDVCKALSHMTQLESFGFAPGDAYRQEFEHQCIMMAGTRLHKDGLVELKLSGNLRAWKFWNPPTTHLRSLTLSGDIFSLPASRVWLRALFEKHRREIEELTLPLELGPLFHPLPLLVPPSPTTAFFSSLSSLPTETTLTFPNLKRLTLRLESGGPLSRVHDPWVAFLDKLEYELDVLDWVAMDCVPKQCLRMVREVRGGIMIVDDEGDDEDEESGDGESEDDEQLDSEEEEEESENES